MLSNKKKYDLIFGIGEACSCTQSLRKANLQIASFPLDWLYGSDFVGRCKILASKFNRFIEKKDLSDTFTINGNGTCEIYYNKHNNITFNHDFTKGSTFDTEFIKVKEKYNRRINRLLSQIEKSSKILIVYLETPTTKHVDVDDKTIIKGYNIIKKTFNKNIDLLYIANKKKERKKERKLSQNITKIVCDYKSIKPKDPDYAVNMNVTKSILKFYKLNLPLSYYLKKKIIKIFVNIIPIKTIRHKLRKKYHL